MDGSLFRTATLAASTIILAAIFFGVSQRRRRHIHIPTMLSCFVADMTLLVIVELNRDAILVATRSSRPIVHVHVALSVATLLGWLFALFSGNLRRRGRLVRAHRYNAILFLLFRTGNWITAFFVA